MPHHSSSIPTKKILLNAFDMNCVGHINHGLWAHPNDESHRFNELSYWTDLAKTLENGLFEGCLLQTSQAAMMSIKIIWTLL